MQLLIIMNIKNTTAVSTQKVVILNLIYFLIDSCKNYYKNKKYNYFFTINEKF